MYEVGKVYIWRNKRGILAYLNGTETTALNGMGVARCVITGVRRVGQWTDTPTPCGRGKVLAGVGELVPKRPPSGEKLVRDMFEPKPVMEPA